MSDVRDRRPAELHPGEQGSKPRQSATARCRLLRRQSCIQENKDRNHWDVRRHAGRLTTRQSCIQENKDRNSIRTVTPTADVAAGRADPGEQGSKPRWQCRMTPPTGVRRQSGIQENKDRNLPIDGRRTSQLGRRQSCIQENKDRNCPPAHGLDERLRVAGRAASRRTRIETTSRRAMQPGACIAGRAASRRTRIETSAEHRRTTIDMSCRQSGIQENKDRNPPTATAIDLLAGAAGRAVSRRTRIETPVPAIVRRSWRPGRAVSRRTRIETSSTTSTTARRRARQSGIQENKDRNLLTLADRSGPGRSGRADPGEQGSKQDGPRPRHRRPTPAERYPGEQGSKPQLPPAVHERLHPGRAVSRRTRIETIGGNSEHRRHRGAGRAVSRRTRIETALTSPMAVVSFVPAERYPGEQGSKLRQGRRATVWNWSGRAVSRRTRIETASASSGIRAEIMPAERYPGEQGSKPVEGRSMNLLQPSRQSGIQENKDRNPVVSSVFTSRRVPAERYPGEQGSKPRSRAPHSGGSTPPAERYPGEQGSKLVPETEFFESFYPAERYPGEQGSKPSGTIAAVCFSSSGRAVSRRTRIETTTSTPFVGLNHEPAERYPGEQGSKPLHQ